jgi:hypothetical protein
MSLYLCVGIFSAEAAATAATADYSSERREVVADEIL